jgi:hypothetical protein
MASSQIAATLYLQLTTWSASVKPILAMQDVKVMPHAANYSLKILAVATPSGIQTRAVVTSQTIHAGTQTHAVILSQMTSAVQ